MRDCDAFVLFPFFKYEDKLDEAWQEGIVTDRYGTRRKVMRMTRIRGYRKFYAIAKHYLGGRIEQHRLSQ